MGGSGEVRRKRNIGCWVHGVSILWNDIAYPPRALVYGCINYSYRVQNETRHQNCTLPCICVCGVSNRRSCKPLVSRERGDVPFPTSFQTFAKISKAKSLKETKFSKDLNSISFVCAYSECEIVLNILLLFYIISILY